MQNFDYRESTISFDYEKRVVEFYFTRRSNYEQCLKRNPHCILAQSLDPGYRILYPFKQCRTPEYLLRVVQKQANTADFQSQEALK